MWKSCQSFRTKWAQWPANGPVWMPQALKPLCLILFWILALWGNKNWLPSMKKQKLKIFWSKSDPNGLQMVQLECPRHRKPTVSFFFGVGRIPFSHYWPSGVIRICSSVWKLKSWNLFQQNGLKRVQMVQFECSKHRKPALSFFFGVVRIPFSHYCPSGVIRIGSPVWKWKSWKFVSTKWA